MAGIRRDVIVVGGSAGALDGVLDFASKLPADLPAAVFIVIHTSPQYDSILPDLIRRDSRLPAAHAVDREPIKRGRIYVAPPDFHLLVKPGFVQLSHGPYENRFRPAIDPLFRSAAVAYDQRVVGVILSGGLDDGTHGSMLVKRHCGMVIVQNPEVALIPSMPLSVLRNVEVDHILPANEIAGVVVKLAGDPVPGEDPHMSTDKVEAYDVVEGRSDALRTSETLGPPSVFACPECGGTLWEYKDDHFIRYRCHVGHGYTAETLRVGQRIDVEESIWQAIRGLEESGALSRHLAHEFRGSNQVNMSVSYEISAQKAMSQADRLREVLLDIRENSYQPGATDPQPPPA
jgi:two-component system chemotaxis response regulator CheB